MVDVNDILEKYLFKKVKIKTLSRPFPFNGYLVDINQPVANGVRWCFLEEGKADKYVESFQPKWLTPLLHEVIDSLEILEEGTEIENSLIVHHLN